MKNFEDYLDESSMAKQDHIDKSMYYGYFISQEPYFSEEDKHSEDKKTRLCAQLELYVWKLIHERFSTFVENYNDLFNEGILAIMEAAPRYDEEKGKLTTYFQPYILHAMCEYVNKNITNNTAHYMMAEKKMNDILREQGKINNIEDYPVEFFVQHGMSPKTVAHVLKQKQMRKVEITMGIPKKTGFWENIYENTPESLFLAKQTKDCQLSALKEVFPILSENQRFLLTKYFGLNDTAPTKATVLGKELNVPVYEIRREIGRALKILKKELYKKGKKSLLSIA